jgi:hypothetical protein
VPTARPPGAAFALASGPRGERAAPGQGMRELRLPHGDPMPAAGVGAFHVGRCPDTARRDVRAAETGPGAGLDPGGTEDGIRCCCAASGVRLLAGPGTTYRASAAVAPRRGIVGIDDGTGWAATSRAGGHESGAEWARTTPPRGWGRRPCHPGVHHSGAVNAAGPRPGRFTARSVHGTVSRFTARSVRTALPIGVGQGPDPLRSHRPGHRTGPAAGSETSGTRPHRRDRTTSARGLRPSAGDPGPPPASRRAPPA